MNSSTEKTDTGLSCEFKENLSVLRQINFFSKLPMEVLKVLAYLCTRESFKAGEYLFEQKDDDGRALYIVSGAARLEHQSDEGGRTVREVGPGTFFGSLALLSEAPRLFSLKATSESVCLVISRKKFQKTIEQFPQIVPEILKEIVDSVHTWEKRFMAGSVENCANCMKRVGVSLV